MVRVLTVIDRLSSALAAVAGVLLLILIGAKDTQNFINNFFGIK